MKFIKKLAILTSGVSIALSIYQFIILVDLLERLARLLPRMQGIACMGLIIASAIGELAFIYTRYAGYVKNASSTELMRKFVSVALVQFYLLVFFAPARVILLAHAFGIPMTTKVLEAGSTVDTALFVSALIAAGLCNALLSLAQPAETNHRAS